MKAKNKKWKIAKKIQRGLVKKAGFFDGRFRQKVEKGELHIS